MKLSMGLSIGAITTQVARLARDLWGKVIDIWENEHRKWEDIV
tara:strand:- start:52 stop:180 length:129 start_codon:yes stop_codon:yes gene_type:complete